MAEDVKKESRAGKKKGKNEKGETEVEKKINIDELSPAEKFKYLGFELIDIGVH